LIKKIAILFCLTGSLLVSAQSGTNKTANVNLDNTLIISGSTGLPNLIGLQARFIFDDRFSVELGGGSNGIYNTAHFGLDYIYLRDQKYERRKGFTRYQTSVGVKLHYLIRNDFAANYVEDIPYFDFENTPAISAAWRKTYIRKSTFSTQIGFWFQFDSTQGYSSNVNSIMGFLPYLSLEWGFPIRL
jgi:hypothetical protein